MCGCSAGTGSFLQSKSHESDWEAIVEGDFWNLCEGNDSIMPILRLSYDCLAIELKQCFAYCSLYPKDWRYVKDELIDLWMAQGFLENEDEKQSPENIGEEYVHILLKKSFLLDVQTNELGEIKSFKLHDLMHDLSQLIATADYCFYAVGRKNVERHLVHASFEEHSDSSLNMLDPNRLRTLLQIKEKCERNTNTSHSFAFKRLRSLDLSFNRMRELPESVGKMSHLRYLNLSCCSQLTCLPKTISNLVNLQTLRLTGTTNLKFSVDIITKLINLRKLEIYGCKAFEDGMPFGLCRVTTLQSLSHFIVGNNDKERKKAKLNELKELNLRGELTIEKLGLVVDVEEESKDVNLRTKKNLFSLCLTWGDSWGDLEMKNSNPEQLFENLCPHQNLKELRIEQYPGVCLSDWLLSCRNLVQLIFFDIGNCQYLPTLEGLISLKLICLQWMEKLEYIYYKGGSSSTNFFPSLESLTIRECTSLRGWIREATVQYTRDDNECHHALPSFSCLLSLVIYDCPNLSCMPPFPNLVRCLELTFSSSKPLLDTLNVRAIGPSTSEDHAASLSKLEFLDIGGINIEGLPEEWMQNLSSLKSLSIGRFSSLETPFRHMLNLPATLEDLVIHEIDSWCGDEDYNIHCQDLCCLHSLQRIFFSSCSHLVALPEWICDLRSLRFINVLYCRNLESFPQGMCRLTNLQTLQLNRTNPALEEKCKKETGAEWPKIAHIPNIWIDIRRI